MKYAYKLYAYKKEYTNLPEYPIVGYPGCCPGESLAVKSFRKINTKLQFLYIQNEFLNPKLRRLLCNSLIITQFDCACISWYSLISQKMRKKLQVTQNECIHFCLKITLRQHMRAK